MKYRFLVSKKKELLSALERQEFPLQKTIYTSANVLAVMTSSGLQFTATELAVVYWRPFQEIFDDQSTSDCRKCNQPQIEAILHIVLLSFQSHLFPGKNESKFWL